MITPFEAKLFFGPFSFLQFKAWETIAYRQLQAVKDAILAIAKILINILYLGSFCQLFFVVLIRAVQNGNDVMEIRTDTF